MIKTKKYGIYAKRIMIKTKKYGTHAKKCSRKVETEGFLRLVGTSRLGDDLGGGV